MPTIQTNFEGGNVGRVEQVSEMHFRIGAKGEKDQDGRNRQANWYSFRLDGLKPSVPVTVDMVDLPGEYNYKPNRGAITKDTPPVVSDDGESWRHLETWNYDANEPKLTLILHPRQRSLSVAHVTPYTNRNLLLLREKVGSHPAFEEELIGSTLGNRDLRLWTVREGDAARRTIWLMFRQHSWETGSSWAGEGAVTALLARDEKAQQMRRDVIWKIFPLCDPDGVARGGVRFNSLGFDLNRNWDVEDRERMPEIAAQRDAIRQWIKAGRKVDLFLTLHNTETGEYLEGPPEPPPPAKTLAENLFRNLVNETTFRPSRPLSFAAATTTAGMKGRMNVAQGLAHEFGIAAFVMEQRISFNDKLKRLPLREDRLRFGAELVRAMWMS